MTHGSEIPLQKFGDPIQVALREYEIIAGSLQFDGDKAARLELTPNKPYYARSTSNIYKFWGSRKIAELVVLVFAPGDGTGNERDYQLAELQTGNYPREPKIVPKLMKGIHSAAHLTIASWRPGARGVVPFAGSLTQLGIRGNQVVQTATLGQNADEFQQAMAQQAGVPTTTFSISNLDLLTGPQYNRGGARYGDPNAMYNGYVGDNNIVQVCGLVALQVNGPLEVPRLLHAEFLKADFKHLFRGLGAQQPRDLAP